MARQRRIEKAINRRKRDKTIQEIQLNIIVMYENNESIIGVLYRTNEKVSNIKQQILLKLKYDCPIEKITLLWKGKELKNKRLNIRKLKLNPTLRAIIS